MNVIFMRPLYEAVILCDCIIKEDIFLNLQYTPDVTVFIGPSVCSKTEQDLS